MASKQASSKQGKPGINVTLPDFKKFSVTAADIKKGKQGDAEWCPIACALRRELGELSEYISDLKVTRNEASVSLNIPIRVPIYVNGQSEDEVEKTVSVKMSMDLSDKASEFVSQFDDDKKVHPSVFSARNLNVSSQVNDNVGW